MIASKKSLFKCIFIALHARSFQTTTIILKQNVQQMEKLIFIITELTLVYKHFETIDKKELIDLLRNLNSKITLSMFGK